MRVGAAIAQGGGTDIWHGATYTDPKTELARQFDFRFKITQGDRRIAFAAECKNINPDSPVVVCGCPRVKKEAYHDVVVAHGSRTATTSRVRSGLAYAEDGFVGKSVLRPESISDAKLRARSSDAEIYGKWSQAVASAHDLLTEAIASKQWLFTVVLPVVIVPEDTLWTASYDPAGNLAMDPAPSTGCSFYVGHQYQLHDATRNTQPATLSHIHFFTLPGFAVFLARLEARVIDWDHWIPDDLRDGFDRTR